MSAAQELILTKRMAMINKEDALSDVTFLVGAKKSKLTAHKIFLITASDVFEAMFSNKFETADAKVVVEDMEEDSFLQVLHYCYTLKVKITEKNMLGILYGAEKYMIHQLKEQTASYVFERINESNCLEIFNFTFLLDCANINEKCLNMFQENPMMFFEDASFKELSLSALKKLAGLQKINCTGADMKRAVHSWFIVNKGLETVDDEVLSKHGFLPSDFRGKQFQSLSRLGNHVMVTRKFKCNITIINIPDVRELFGVGLCLGISGDPKDEMVELIIYQKEKVIQNVERKVKQSENSSVVDIMFRELKMLPGTYSIKVKFETEQLRFASTNSICQKRNHYSYNKCYHGCHNDTYCYKPVMWPGDLEAPFSCVAYLIYATSSN